jgi:hypothetical protein
VRKCPLCLRDGVSAGHIASHLQRIASFALPRLHEEANTTGQEVEVGDPSDSDYSTNSSINDEPVDGEKTVHLVLQRPSGKNRWMAVALNPMDSVHPHLTKAVRLFLALDDETEFKFTDEDGTEIPLQYDLLYNGRVIYVQPLSHPAFDTRSPEEQIRGRPLQTDDATSDIRRERGEMLVFQREGPDIRNIRNETQVVEDSYSLGMAVNIPTGSVLTKADLSRPKDGILRRIGRRLGIGRDHEDSPSFRISETNDPQPRPRSESIRANPPPNEGNGNITRRLSRKVVPGLPRTQTSMRQQSELLGMFSTFRAESHSSQWVGHTKYERRTSEWGVQMGSSRFVWRKSHDTRQEDEDIVPEETASQSSQGPKVCSAC